MNENKLENSSIYYLEYNDIDQASSLYVKAFFDYPTINWYFPKLEEKEKKLKDVFAFVFKMAICHSEVVSTSNDLKGIVIWQDSHNKKIGLWQQIRCGGLSLLYKVGYTPVKKLMFLDSYWKKLEKKHIKSHHLLLYHIGVDPKWQGKGLASILIKHKLKELEKENIPVYVQTNTEQNVLIYKHLGFKEIEKLIIPTANIPQWCMIRYP